MFEEVYERLRQLAERQFQRNAAVTLQPTALVHEVYLRLNQQDPTRFQDREHFFAVAATAMRQIVIDHARRRLAAKRGGDRERVPLNEILTLPSDAAQQATLDVLQVDEILSNLAELHARQARIVELRIFVGLTVPEVAEVLQVSTATVEKDWRQARAWLRLELDRGASP